MNDFGIVPTYRRTNTYLETFRYTRQGCSRYSKNTADVDMWRKKRKDEDRFITIGTQTSVRTSKFASRQSAPKFNRGCKKPMLSHTCVGIVPVKAFPSSWRIAIWFKFPNSDGIIPMRSLS
jgi:hypothetical protein